MLVAAADEICKSRDSKITKYLFEPPPKQQTIKRNQLDRKTGPDQNHKEFKADNKTRSRHRKCGRELSDFAQAGNCWRVVAVLVLNHTSAIPNTFTTAATITIGQLSVDRVITGDQEARSGNGWKS